jgi:hypothetical protein
MRFITMLDEAFIGANQQAAFLLRQLPQEIIWNTLINCAANI